MTLLPEYGQYSPLFYGNRFRTGEYYTLPRLLQHTTTNAGLAYDCQHWITCSSGY